MFGMHRHRVGRLSIQRVCQLTFAVLINGYAVGFQKGKIYTGKSKALCVPVLNCYSCPGALGACPIGSLQTVLGGREQRVPFYVLGMLMLVGILIGRAACGLLCPFGLVQDLLHKIPAPKIKVPLKIDKPARYLKYLLVLVVIVLASVCIHRPFCRYLCPLGAFYALFQRFSFYRLHLDTKKCIDCKKCEHSCPMAVEVTKNINSPECIRCGKCKAVCPTGAISSAKQVEKGEALFK